ncbi:MAG: His/Gly/Thr/Pro-type tRNA ligase C-terminal domain-containing protein, partial [Gammaproteobacteria bacterium]
AGFEVALDNRALRPGVMFKDAELLGIPHRLVLSERSLERGTVEYRARTEEQSRDIPREEVVNFLRNLLRAAT